MASITLPAGGWHLATQAHKLSLLQRGWMAWVDMLATAMQVPTNVLQYLSALAQDSQNADLAHVMQGHDCFSLSTTSTVAPRCSCWLTYQLSWAVLATVHLNLLAPLPAGA